MKVRDKYYIVILSNHELFYSALKKAIADYDTKQLAGNATDKTLYSLGWTVDELSRLNELCQDLHVEVTTAIEHLEDRSMSWTTTACSKASRNLLSIKTRLREFVQGVTQHKRTSSYAYIGYND